MAKKTAIQKRDPNAGALTPLEQQLAEEARNESSKETLGVPRITHKAGVIKIDNKPVQNNKLPLAVVDYVFARAYYEGDYDDQTPQTPVCYAFSKDQKSLKPHEQAPNKQSDQCSTCPHDAFGTADRGRGKRCKDERRVICVINASDADSIQKAEMRQFSIPPGSLKSWGSYLNILKEVVPATGGNVRTVMTELSTQPGDKGGHVLTFKATDRLAEDGIQMILAKRKEAEASLFAAYPNIEAAEKPSPKAAKRNKKVE